MFSNFKVCENGKLTVKVKKKVAKGAPEPGGGGRMIVCGIFFAYNYNINVSLSVFD